MTDSALYKPSSPQPLLRPSLMVPLGWAAHCLLESLSSRSFSKSDACGWILMLNVALNFSLTSKPPAILYRSSPRESMAMSFNLNTVSISIYHWAGLLSLPKCFNFLNQLSRTMWASPYWEVNAKDVKRFDCGIWRGGIWIAFEWLLFCCWAKVENNLLLIKNNSVCGFVADRSAPE